MIRFLATFVLVGCASATVDPNTFNCDATAANNIIQVPTGFPRQVCYDKTCTDAIKLHIKEEFNAAFLYLHMGAIFAQDSVARPGMAKFMLESASEERSHANLMLDYLNKRGVILTKEDVGLNFAFNQDKISEGKTGLTMQDALKKALKMEIGVTDLINNVITSCNSDYHGADVFTNPILDEQHDGMRKLQGVVREFEDLLTGHGDQGKGMVEFIMDQKILKGGL